MATKGNDSILDGNGRYWCDNQMRAGEWYEVKPEQLEIFKQLIAEKYGWPEYSLNFSADMKRIMKVMTKL